MASLAILIFLLLALLYATSANIRNYANVLLAYSVGTVVILLVGRWFLVWLRDALVLRYATPSQFLDSSERLLRRTYSLLTDQRDTWLVHSEMVLDLQDELGMRQYSLFRNRNPEQASPILKILQGPVSYKSGTRQATTEKDNRLQEIIRICIRVTDGIDRYLVRHASVVQAVLDGNESALKIMRYVLSGSGRSSLSKFDGLMKLVENNNELMLEQGALIDKTLTLHTNAIAKRQGILDELVMTASSDILIGLMNLPSGWQTLQANNSPETTSTGPGRLNQGLLTDDLGSGATVPADIVDNVHELSRIFRGPSKETDEAAAQHPSLLSQAKEPPRAAQLDPQHAEEMEQLRKAQEDLQKLRVRVERLQKDHKTSLTDQKAKARDQNSQAMEIFVSKVKLCLGPDLLQLSGSMRERWQRYVRSVTGREGKQPEASKPTTDTTDPTASADCESTTTTIIG